MPVLGVILADIKPVVNSKHRPHRQILYDLQDIYENKMQESPVDVTNVML